jgi:MFS family permease
MAGTDASAVAIGFALYEQTHSAQWLSLSLMLTIGTGAVLAPLGGKAGDLLDRRRLMIGAELASFTVFLVLAFLHTPAALLAIGVIASAIGTVFGPASGAALAHVAGEERMSWANGLISMSTNVGKTAGRFFGGILIAMLGASSVFVLDSLTFLISALVIMSVHQSFSSRRPAEKAAKQEQKEGGFRLVVGHPDLRLVVASAVISTFATAFTMTAEIPLVFELGVGAIGLGALTACWGIGMVLGSWYGGRVLRSDNEPTGVLAGRLVMAAGIGLVAASPHLGLMLACYLIGGAGGGFMGVAVQSFILRSAPDHLRARTLGAIEAGRNVAFGLGVAGAGAMVGLVGARPVYAVVGMVLVLGTLPVAALVMRRGGPRSLRHTAALAPA